MSTADLGLPILYFILIFWAFLAIMGILTSLVKQGKISGRHFLQKHRGVSGHRRHRHHIDIGRSDSHLRH